MAAGGDGQANWEVLIVRYGTLATTRGEVFLHYDAYDEPDGQAQLDYYFWIARNGERTVVIDTGYEVSDGSARGRTTLLDPREALAQLVPSGKPVDLIVTHCHYDHIGNLAALPGSRVVITESEFAFWRSNYAQRPLFRMTGSADGMAELERAEREGRLTTFADRLELHPGIEVVRLGGHTPGQAIVLVDTADGRVLLASDASHLDEELELDRPFWIMADVPAGYEGLDLIRELRDRGEVVHVISGHQPGILDHYPAAGEGPEGLVGVIGRAAQ